MSSFQRGQRRREGLGAAVEAVQENARSLGAPEDLDGIVESAADASYVLIGEASHGTSEFYRWRAHLTARLVSEHDVAFVGVEGDWTDCYECNRYVRGESGTPADARSVVAAFDRWPTWMWANWEAVAFLEWLADYNADRPSEERVGFYGIDVYSLFESMDAVVDYLADRDPDLAARARDAYHCFEPYGEDAREYAQSTRLVPEDCEDEVVEILTDLRREAGPAAPGQAVDEEASSEDAFAAEQNALVVKNAEEYYRAMATGGAESWNVRDRHMTETVDRLRDRPESRGTAVVWAHNTHVGDARATDMADHGKVNLGQLLRERHGSGDVYVVGFGTHRGSVVAGEAWDAPVERMSVPSATETSYGDVFHRADVGDAALQLTDSAGDLSALEPARGHRAIGVVYNPERELGNYVPTVLPERYDAVVHVEDSSALHPLHAEFAGSEPPETYPWGV